MYKVYKFFICNKKASSTVEAAITFVIYFVVLLSFFLLLILRYLQLSFFDAQLNVSKEISLAYAYYYGYVHQKSHLINEKKENKVDVNFWENEKNNYKLPRWLVSTFKNNFSTITLKNLIGKRLAEYWKDRKILPSWKKRLRDLSYSLDLNDSSDDNLGYIKSFAKVNLFFYEHQFNLDIPFFTWEGNEGSFLNKLINKEDREEENPWMWHNFKRGKYFIKKEGGNLPNNYPSIHRFKNGEATMIKSLDLTAPTYQSPENLHNILETWILKLSSFKGTSVPFGKEKIFITEKDIKFKKIIIILPKNSSSELVNKVKSYLDSKKIFYEIKYDEVSTKYKKEPN